MIFLIKYIESVLYDIILHTYFRYIMVEAWNSFIKLQQIQ